MAKAKAKKNSRMIRTKASLVELIQSEQFIPYMDDVGDHRHEKVRWNIFGDCRYNLLWIVVTNIANGEQFIECIKSVVYTPMKERVHSMDDADAGLAEMHTEDMWNKYKDRLTK